MSNNVFTGQLTIIWDGINRPEEKEGGMVSHSVSCLINPQAQEFPALEALAKKCLNESEFKGNLPHGANWWYTQVDHTKSGLEQFEGWYQFNASTTNGIPLIIDANNNKLTPLQYKPMLYAGSIVQVLVHAWAYNNKSKGVKMGLDGIKIIDATTPRLALGGGISESEAMTAMGAAQPPAATAQPPAATAQPSEAFIAPPPAPGAAPTPPSAPPAGPVMTEKAKGYTYEDYKKLGWTDDQLITEGIMLR